MAEEKLKCVQENTKKPDNYFYEKVSNVLNEYIFLVSWLVFSMTHVVHFSCKLCRLSHR